MGPIDFLPPQHFDGIAPDDDTTDLDNRHHQPHAVPDHGRQPKRRERPLLAAYKRDPHNLYRPAGDPFVASLHDDGADAEERRFSAERQVARLLTKTARDHAPRLRWRSDSAITEMIAHEVLPDARFIVQSLAPDAARRVLDKFLAVLWAEIGLLRIKKPNTKT